MPQSSRRKQRLLFLDYTNGIGLGGGQRSLQLLLEELDRDRYELALACPPDEQLLDRLPADVHVHPLPLPDEFRELSRREGSWTRVIASLPAITQLRRHWSATLERARPDLIHANNLKMLFLAAAAAPLSNIPRLWHVRDILPRTSLTQLLKRAGSRLAARVLAVSNAVRRELPPSAPSEIVYNAVRMPSLQGRNEARQEFRQRHDIDQSACIIGYAGRMDSGKGLGVLLEAFCQLSVTYPRAELLFAGQGPVEDSLRQIAGLRGVTRRIHFAGFQDSMAGVWNAMDIAVVPSTEPDSFPRSVIEAMAYRLPVAGADTGGIGESIQHGETGFLTPPGDAAALSKALELLISNERLRRSQGDAGRARCERLFSAQAQARRLDRIYEEVLRIA